MGADDVKTRLESLGYTIKEPIDSALIAFAWDKVENTVKNNCNVDSVPEGLKQVAIDMAVAEFLTVKKTQYPADLEGFDLSGAVESLREGDTQITFKGATDSEKLDALISHLQNYGTNQFSHYRKLRW